MMQLTLRVVGKTLFDADIEADAREVGQALPVALKELNDQMVGIEFLLPDIIPTPSRIRLKRAVSRLDPLIYRIIAQRRGSSEDHGDLLSVLLRAQDEDGSRMTDRQLARRSDDDRAWPATRRPRIALTWAWYLLSQHPDVRAKLHAEIGTVLGDRPPTLADIPALTYTEAVLSSKRCDCTRRSSASAASPSQPCELGRLHLPAGTNVYIVPWIIQRDPRWFDDPEAFRPERWLDGLAHRLPRFAYFPFGGGPRLCIGQQFAMLEATILLVTIARRWRVVPVPGQDLVPEPSLTLRPKHGLHVEVQPR